MGVRFSAPVQTGAVTNPASHTMGTGSFLVVKRPGRGVDHPPHLQRKLKEEYSYTHSPSRPSSPALGRTLPLQRPNSRSEAQVLSQVGSCGIGCKQYSMAQGFLISLRFPPPVNGIPPVIHIRICLPSTLLRLRIENIAQ